MLGPCFGRSHEPEGLARPYYVCLFSAEDIISTFTSVISHHTHNALRTSQRFFQWCHVVFLFLETISSLSVTSN
jgi:hypothetical protein